MTFSCLSHHSSSFVSLYLPIRRLVVLVTYISDEPIGSRIVFSFVFCTLSYFLPFLSLPSAVFSLSLIHPLGRGARVCYIRNNDPGHVLANLLTYYFALSSRQLSLCSISCFVYTCICIRHLRKTITPN
ncbi:hypothetical protein SISSUDRAFT_186179 [Sistotremastrum suecicum HHB10207 ss-3]|uniref:Uncharacterized protein n=1 Tax=Sistotremastrum suecicum HHB10207 ss-3 TaxID=1314776 RepID=A0A166AFW0_9AGAM|nr:hypothetical protein SISSUDRAFT_186179 [Sistotremastrum suecicum HHB10207 ss-3]